jgi:hypothetical protein
VTTHHHQGAVTCAGGRAIRKSEPFFHRLISSPLPISMRYKTPSPCCREPMAGSFSRPSFPAWSICHFGGSMVQCLPIGVVHEPSIAVVQQWGAFIHACAKEFRTFPDLSEKLNMPVTNLMQQCNGKPPPSGKGGTCDRTIHSAGRQ